MSQSRQQDSSSTEKYRVDPRWVAGGLAVTSLLALADVGKTWYWFPQQIPVHLSLYALSIWVVYASWVGVGVFIGWFRLRLATANTRPAFVWGAHGIMSLAIGLSHLLADAAIVWQLYQPGIAMRGFSALYAEKLVAWLPYEILAYWGCLAVFTLMAMRRAPQKGAESEFLQRLTARQNDQTIVIDAADIDCIEAMDNYVVVNANAQRYVLNDTMARLEKALDPDQFQRIHRSLIVNLRRVSSLQKGGNGNLEVVLRSGRTLPVSRRRRAAVRRRLGAVRARNPAAAGR